MSVVPKKGKVAVIGAGVSGLCFTYFLLKIRPDVQISIFEANTQPGGWIKTEILKDDAAKLQLEKGPRTLRGVSDGSLLIVDILRQLKLENEVEVMNSKSLANRKWLLDPANKLIQVPNSFKLMANFLFSDITLGIIPSIFLEPFRKKTSSTEDESVRSFIQRRFGTPALADNILSAIFHGIYSGDVSKLSAQATLPLLVQLEQKHGSIVKAMFQKLMAKKREFKLNPLLSEYEKLISPKAKLSEVSQSLKKYPIMRLNSGLQIFPKALATYLQKLENVKIYYNTPIHSIDLARSSLRLKDSMSFFDHIHYTGDAKSLGKLANVEGPVRSTIQSFEYTTIFLANVYSKRGGLIPQNQEGFGFLVPVRNPNPQSLLGVIYDSDTELDAEKFFIKEQRTDLPARVPYDKITLMMGGHFYNTRGVPSDMVNVKITKEVLSKILAVDLSKYNVIIRDEAAAESKNISLKDNDLLISYNLHKDCIPQYNVGFMDKVHKMVEYMNTESKGKFTIGGTSLGKLGVPDCVMNSLEGAINLK